MSLLSRNHKIHKSCLLLVFLSLLVTCLFQIKYVFARGKADSEGVKWSFDYRNFKGRIEIYEVPKDFSWEVGEIFTYRDGVELPFKTLAPSPINISRRQRRTLALVIRNKTSEPWYFFANFHNIYPSEKAFGASLACLCTNHIFEVKPNTTWARIVQVRTHGTFREKVLDFRHEIVGLSAAELAQRRLQGHVDSGSN
jgi:hypothetical protein